MRPAARCTWFSPNVGLLSSRKVGSSGFKRAGAWRRAYPLPLMTGIEHEDVVVPGITLLVSAYQPSASAFCSLAAAAWQPTPIYQQTNEVSIPNYRCVPHAFLKARQCSVRRPIVIIGRSDAGGNTHQHPSSCRKKSSARDPNGNAVSTHTYRLRPKRVRLNSVTRTGAERPGASHLSTCVRSEYSCVDFMCCSGK